MKSVAEEIASREKIQELGKILEKSFRSRQKEKEYLPGIMIERCTGKLVSEMYYTALRRAWSFNSSDTPIEKLLTVAGIWLYDNGYTLKSKDFIRSLVGTEDGINFLKNILKNQEAKETRCKRIMKDILMTLQYLCILTSQKREETPSEVLKSLATQKLLVNFLDSNKISKYFLVLIPQASDFIVSAATQHLDLVTNKMVFDPQFRDLIKYFPTYLQEAKEACRFCGFNKENKSILQITDSYYNLHKNEYAKS